MGKSKLRGKDLLKLGFEQGRAVGIALSVMAKHYKRVQRTEKLAILTSILEAPKTFLEDEILGIIAKELVEKKATTTEIALKETRQDYRTYGSQHIQKEAKSQMDIAMRLPVAAAGALMPDAHSGYGLPIGGVLAVENAVIPYGVGVDIGCRMCLSIFDMSASYLKGHFSQFKRDLMEHTRFGMGCEFTNPLDDPIFDRDEFNTIAIAKRLKHRALKQIGTSGGGNHFVEYGMVNITDIHNEFKLPLGKYVAILSHSGSRGLGANIANFYTKKAMEICKLPKQAKHLAWLGLDTQVGQEYWAAMNLAGDYASACHHQIHRRLAKAMGEKPVAMVENHHNFAWKETLADGRSVVVHRKGATPAGKGVLGIIPGSMTAPGFIVRGKGNFDSINSASHGAGRQMSRTKAIKTINRKEIRAELQRNGVTLLGGGIDEAPMAYKDIHTVMAAQRDLVEVIGTFSPKIVRMADD